MNESITVLKFGSSVLRSAADLPNAAHEIYRWYRQQQRVIAVVSALDGRTDRLLAEAAHLSATPDPHALAELLATGERESAALLALALDRSGIPSRIVDPREIGLSVAGDPLDADPLTADEPALRSLLEDHPVLIIPGFFGIGANGRTHLLGRGGSDLTAVFLARLLATPHCRLIKDVDGVYDSDPALAATHPEIPPPQRFSTLSYGEARRVAGKLIQPKAIACLESARGRAHISAPFAEAASLIHEGPISRQSVHPQPPTSVVLLGLGTVGFGVYQRFLANPAQFEVLGALVRHPYKHRAAGVPDAVLHTNPSALLGCGPELVIDALPGVSPSSDLIAAFLRQGAHVVSANKAAIAAHGTPLTALAERHQVSLRYSAAVGGAAPMIEALDRAWAHGKIRALAAVLNGTCNYILDRCAEGIALNEAIAEAQAAGFAEADPSDDLKGEDAARKLRILCAHAFDEVPEQIETEGLNRNVAERARRAATRGLRIRQVARVHLHAGDLIATIRFETLERDHPLARLEREWNGLQITSASSPLRWVSGRGAGRWPTAEAVMADAFEVRRARGRSPQRPAHLPEAASLDTASRLD